VDVGLCLPGFARRALKRKPSTVTAIIPTAEPFFFPGGKVGCLLVHGFTGSPKEMRWMGEYMSEKGHTVLGIRLPGHATCPADMLNARWPDWLAAVEDGWHILNGATHGGPIFLMGLSMGGILSLLFAAQAKAGNHPVAGVVAMSTPYSLREDWRLRYIKSLRYIQPSMPKGAPDWRNPDAAGDHIDYPYYPTRSIAELRDLLVEMRKSLPEMTVPALLVHSRTDSGGGSFHPDSMEKIFANLGSREKQMIWVEDSGHVVTREPEREKIFQAATDFICRFSQGSV
jgi:carboxylesterase